MAKIVFVGDRPSKHNLSPDVAFVGTKSYKTLLSWIEQLKLNNADYQLVNAYNAVGELQSLPPAIAYVALGVNASKALIGKKHYKLPHPSGLNRQLNDKNSLQQKLQGCKLYLRQVLEEHYG